MLTTMKKIPNFNEVTKFEEIPNIGKRIAGDFRLIGLKNPNELKKQNPLDLYNRIGLARGHREDPCMLDVCMAAIDFMNGKEPRSWWYYTPKRKKQYPDI